MTEPSREREKQRRVTKRKIITVLLVLAALCLAIVYFLPPREPVYAGEPLSHWLKGYDPIEGSEPGRQKADEIMREAGTNAIPTLLRMLKERDSPWKVKLIALAQKQHFITIRHVEAYRRNIQAEEAFEKLGSDGKAAVPELIEIYEMNLSRSSQARITRIFGYIGPPAKKAIPLLLLGATGTDDTLQDDAIIALGQIHAEPKMVVPVLIELLPNQYNSTINEVTWALGEFGPNARPAVPALIEILRREVEYTSPCASAALQKIDPEAAARVKAENLQAVK